MSNLITTDLQKQQVETSAGSGEAAELVELFELQLPDKSFVYFHPGVNDDFSDVTFRDSEAPYTVRTYEALPMSIGGLDLQADGASNRPILTVANVTQVFSTEIGNIKNKDLIGCKIIRRKTLSKYLADVDPNTKPPVELKKASYIIDRIKSENNLMVEFECALPYDLDNVQVPRRDVIGKYCAWMYKGQAELKKGGCVWPKDSVRKISDTNGVIRTHTPYFNILDEPLILNSLLNNGTHTGGSWSNTTAYTTDSYVSKGGIDFVCLIEHTGQDPSSTKGYWKKVHVYSIWATGINYAVGSHVKHSDTIWRCIVAHASVSDKSPVHTSVYWVIAEVCGKQLSSCKCRFQFVPAVFTADNQAPSGFKNTARKLPFGGFPGSAKFK
jgi:lambda family phage minor tail protein L